MATIREESQDLFGYSSSNVYSYEKSLILAAVGDLTGNTIDLNSKNPAEANEYRFVVKIGTAATSAGAATLKVVLKHSDDNSTWAAIPGIDTGAIALADLTAGKVVLEGRLPKCTKRYVKAVATNGTAVFTAGTIGGHIETVLP